MSGVLSVYRLGRVLSMILPLALLVSAFQESPRDLYQPLPAWCHKIDAKGTGRRVTENSDGIAKYKDRRTPLLLSDYLVANVGDLSSYPLGAVLPPSIRRGFTRAPQAGGVALTKTLDSGASIEWLVDRENKIRRIFYRRDPAPTDARNLFLFLTKTVARKLGTPSQTIVSDENRRLSSMWMWDSSRAVAVVYTPPSVGGHLATVSLMLLDNPVLRKNR